MHKGLEPLFSNAAVSAGIRDKQCCVQGWGDWKNEEKGLQDKKQNHLKPPEPKQRSIIDSTIVIMFPI